MKRYKEDGSMYYYYYKKKVGRHKKRGRKKKKEKKLNEYDPRWHFKILRFDFNRQVGYVGKYRTLADVTKKKKELLDENKKVEFPVAYVNNRRVSKKLYPYKSEYAVLKQITEDGETNKSLVRNDYGKLVPHLSTSQRYFVYEKFPRLQEETFWVYGYNPKTDRKTYAWIRENLVDSIRKDNNKLLINIYIYKNKVLFLYDGALQTFVICKNKSDSIRMYNLLLERYENDKYTVFSGSAEGHVWKTADTVKRLQDLTGWSVEKIYLPNTTY